MLAMIFIMYPRASVSANRINEVLDTNSKITDGNFDGNTKVTGEIEFKNVSFKYPDADEYVLENISFKANKGDTLAIIGSTGSGKSTIVNLIMRFYDVTDGKILIDGIDIKEYKQEALHEKLGYVPQKAVMFNGSINYNIGYGNNKIDDKKIKKASKIAQASEFVEKMPKKYIKQMICDWEAMSMKFGGSTVKWYNTMAKEERDDLNPNTRIKVKEILESIYNEKVLDEIKEDIK